MQQATSTFALIDRIRNGDSAAFSPLFEEYRRRLAVLAHYRIAPELRARIETDDVLQEVFARAFHDIGNFSYREPGAFLRWLSRIMDHVIADMARFEGRQKRRAEAIVRFRSDSNPEGPDPVDTRTPTKLLAEKEDLLALLEKLNSLPNDYRDVIIWTKIECLSTGEVAERLGKSREATALLLHRALKRFRSLQ
jgi:RNA polymerase sigma-70 factor (ECF subfamily)